jgi:hypothetical protein
MLEYIVVEWINICLRSSRVNFALIKPSTTAAPFCRKPPVEVFNPEIFMLVLGARGAVIGASSNNKSIKQVRDCEHIQRQLPVSNSIYLYLKSK